MESAKILKVESIRRIEEFAAIGPQWRRLAEPFHTPLIEHDWLLSCAEAFQTDGELAVIVVREGEALRAAAPLVRSRLATSGGYRMLGVARLWEPCALLYDGVDSLSILCRALIGLDRPFTLVRLVRDRNVAAALAEAAGRVGWLAPLRAAPAPFVNVAGSWAEFLASMSSRRRYDLRRARKALEKNGVVTVETLRPDAGNLATHLSTALALEASGWKGRRGSAVGKVPATEDFLRRYCERAARAGVLRISFLAVNGRAIAMQIGVDHAKRHWVLKIGYDETWADVSPGMQLMHEVVRRTYESGLTGCEFLGSPEPWLRAWTRAARPCRTYRYYPRTAAGLWGWLHDSADRVRQRVGRIGR